MDKYIGRLLDNRYEILEVIGTGGMAVVYKARCHRLNRLVAIKILKDDYLEDEEFRRRFHSESQAVAMLSHPNIISVYDVSTSITADYIVMELIDGITLKQYMEKKGVLNWKETLHFAIQIAKALEHAHSRGIVHRDIKPHNVMVLKNGSVKVTDFGIARVMSKGNTLTKEALGSVHYISPEQAKGGRVDNRSDIYSLGVVMYEMMSGRPPYDGESPVSVAIQHINGGAVMPSMLNPNIPGGLEQIIMRAMAHEPINRYATATQMLADLDEFRKDPAILFDYNTPPTDEVTKMPKASVEREAVNKTTAERVEQKEIGEKIAAISQRRVPSGTNRRKPTAQKRRSVEDENEAKRSKITTIAIISCAAVMVLAILIFVIVLLGTSAEVEVPSLLGRVYANLGEYAFEVKKDQEVYDDKYKAGVIISQTPNAGGKVVKGGTVYVTVSLGPATEPIYMPDLAGKNEASAKDILKDLNLNLNVKVEKKYSETVKEGIVISTDPAPKIELSAKQEVTIYVSQGMEIKTSAMPEVSGQQLEIAKKILTSQNLNLDIVVNQIHDDTVASGLVINTSPVAGEDLKTGQQVTLNVSLGAKLIPMPKVVGLSYSTAYSVLMTAGFNTENIEPNYVYDNAARDTVIGQSIPEKEEASANATITLTVSKGPGTERTKTVTINVPNGRTEDDYYIMDSTGKTVLTPTPVNGKKTIEVRLTGVGKQSYKAFFSNDSSPVQEVPFEVNFDEYDSNWTDYPFSQWLL